MADTNETIRIEIPDFVTVRELADLMEKTPIEVIKELMRNGIMASINQQIDFETAAIVAGELGYEPVLLAEEEEEEDLSGLPEWRSFYDSEDEKDLIRRPPVITILGHVDHGKTSLLDKIRQAHVQEGEYGGITQHIGAYQTELEGQKITFLDTPGHEAFTEMRARGAKGADIAVLVVAADDGIMPQTKEAISHARAAFVPIIVALNKIDRDNANPEYVKQQLAEHELTPDEWDGDTLVIPVSAATGEGIENLLEAILLVAEDTEILANPNSEPAGTIVEAELDKHRGAMTTLLVQNGTLKKGDVVLAGECYGRIKAMFDEFGAEVKEAPPSMPVQIMGLNNPPAPGTVFEVVESEKVARALIEDRREEAERAEQKAFTLEDLYARLKAGEAKELNLIIKVDVQGSLGPIVDGLNKVTAVEEDGTELKVNIIHTDIGNISESDIMLASASQAIVIGFNVNADNVALKRADAEHVEIRTYNIIYKLFEEIELSLQGMLEPVYEDQTIGTAVVRAVFKIPRIGKIAGCYITDGEATRDSSARVYRGGKPIHEGKLTSLKRFQEDVKEVRQGFECGLNVDKFNDFEEGDKVEFFKSVRVR